MSGSTLSKIKSYVNGRCRTQVVWIKQNIKFDYNCQIKSLSTYKVIKHKRTTNIYIYVI